MTPDSEAVLEIHPLAPGLPKTHGRPVRCVPPRKPGFEASVAYDDEDMLRAEAAAMDAAVAAVTSLAARETACPTTSFSAIRSLA